MELTIDSPSMFPEEFSIIEFLLTQRDWTADSKIVDHVISKFPDTPTKDIYDSLNDLSNDHLIEYAEPDQYGIFTFETITNIHTKVPSLKLNQFKKAIELVTINRLPFINPKFKLFHTAYMMQLFLSEAAFDYNIRYPYTDIISRGYQYFVNGPGLSESINFTTHSKDLYKSFMKLITEKHGDTYIYIPKPLNQTVECDISYTAFIELLKQISPSGNTEISQMDIINSILSTISSRIVDKLNSDYNLEIVIPDAVSHIKSTFVSHITTHAPETLFPSLQKMTKHAEYIYFKAPFILFDLFYGIDNLNDTVTANERIFVNMVRQTSAFISQAPQLLKDIEKFCDEENLIHYVAYQMLCEEYANSKVINYAQQ